MQDRILHALEAFGLAPKKTLKGTMVSLRTVPQKQQVVLDLPSLLSALPAGDERAVAHNAARGIMAVVDEPKNSAGSQWGFIDCTPVLEPCAEAADLVDGG